MSTVNRYAEAAIRRDLLRARVVLHGRSRLGPERRLALTEHLGWLVALTQHGVPEVTTVAAVVRERATAFGRTGLFEERTSLVEAIDGFVRATASIDDWTVPDVVRIARSHLPWLLDALEFRDGPGLVLPGAENPMSARLRASEYRRKRAHLWGTIALTPPRALERVLGYA